MKFLILILIIPSFLFADAFQDGDVYSFTVDNPILVNIYFNIFNAIASFFSIDNPNETFQSLTKLVFVLGGFIVFIKGVLMSLGNQSNPSQGIKEYAKYTLGSMSILAIIYSSYSTIYIKTNNIGTICSEPYSTRSFFDTEISNGGYDQNSLTNETHTEILVENIPTIIAFVFSTVNELGKETTTLANTIFSDSNLDFQSSSTNVDFIQSIIALQKTDLTTLAKNTANADGTDNMQDGKYFKRLVQEHYLQCIAQTGAIDNSTNAQNLISAFLTTGNYMKTMDELMSNNTLVIYKNVSDDSGKLISADMSINNIPVGNFFMDINNETKMCKTVWENEISAVITRMIDSEAVECSKDLKYSLNAQTMRILSPDNNATLPPKAMSQKMGISSGLINAAVDADPTVATEFKRGMGEATANFVTTNIATGQTMAKMIPFLQAGLRAVIYAFFPFVFIVILMPGGLSVLTSYMKTIMWIELWSPIAAVLNMFLFMATSTKLSYYYSSVGTMHESGIAVMSEAAVFASIAGYLFTMIPAVAWLIMNGTADMIGQMSNAMASYMNRTLDSDHVNKTSVMKSEMQRAVNSKAERKVSMAEMDRNVAGISASEDAGKLIAQKSMGLDKVQTASEGATTKNIIDGLAQYNLQQQVSTEELQDTANTKTLSQYGTDSQIDNISKKQTNMLNKTAGYTGLNEKSSIIDRAANLAQVGKEGEIRNRVTSDIEANEDVKNLGIGSANIRGQMNATDVKAKLEKGKSMSDTGSKIQDFGSEDNTKNIKKLNNGTIKELQKELEHLKRENKDLKEKGDKEGVKDNETKQNEINDRISRTKDNMETREMSKVFNKEDSIKDVENSIAEEKNNIKELKSGIHERESKAKAQRESGGRTRGDAIRKRKFDKEKIKEKEEKIKDLEKEKTKLNNEHDLMNSNIPNNLDQKFKGGKTDIDKYKDAMFTSANIKGKTEAVDTLVETEKNKLIRQNANLQEIGQFAGASKIAQEATLDALGNDLTQTLTTANTIMSKLTAASLVFRGLRRGLKKASKENKNRVKKNKEAKNKKVGEKNDKVKEANKNAKESHKKLSNTEKKLENANEKVKKQSIEKSKLVNEKEKLEAQNKDVTKVNEKLEKTNKELKKSLDEQKTARKQKMEAMKENRTAKGRAVTANKELETLKKTKAVEHGDSFAKGAAKGAGKILLKGAFILNVGYQGYQAYGSFSKGDYAMGAAHLADIVTFGAAEYFLEESRKRDALLGDRKMAHSGRTISQSMNRYFDMWFK